MGERIDLATLQLTKALIIWNPEPHVEFDFGECI